MVILFYKFFGCTFFCLNVMLMLLLHVATHGIPHIYSYWVFIIFLSLSVLSLFIFCIWLRFGLWRVYDFNLSKCKRYSRELSMRLHWLSITAHAVTLNKLPRTCIERAYQKQHGNASSRQPADVSSQLDSITNNNGKAFAHTIIDFLK